MSRIAGPKNKAGNVEEFYSIPKRFVAAVMALTATYKLKVVLTYAHTSIYDDESVHIFHEDVEWALKKLNTQNLIVTGDSGADKLRST